MAENRHFTSPFFNTLNRRIQCPSRAVFIDTHEREKSMARPFKQGLQYFPLDVNIFEDEKIQELNLAYGLLGEMVYIRILTMIYANGYYLERTIPSLARIIVRAYETGTPTQEEVESIIRFCGEIHLLDQSMLSRGILTSVAIQKQFILSTRRRKKTDIDQYWLLSTETTEELRKMQNINVDNNRVNDDNNPLFCAENVVNDDNNRVNVDIGTQRKVKESKRKEKRDKTDKTDKAVFGFPKLHFLTNSMLKKKYIDDSSLDLLKFNRLFEEAIDQYGMDDVLMAVDYIVQYSRRAEPPIDDRFGFMKSSLLSNLEMFRHRREFANESFEAWIKRTLL